MCSLLPPRGQEDPGLVPVLSVTGSQAFLLSLSHVVWPVVLAFDGFSLKVRHPLMLPRFHHVAIHQSLSVYAQAFVKNRVPVQNKESGDWWCAVPCSPPAARPNLPSTQAGSPRRAQSTQCSAWGMFLVGSRIREIGTQWDVYTMGLPTTQAFFSGVTCYVVTGARLISLVLHQHLRYWADVVVLFYRWGNRGLERIPDSPMWSQLGWIHVDIKQVTWASISSSIKWP